MKIGDKEWFEELQKVGRFPGMYCFSLAIDKDGNKYVPVKVIDTKSTNPNNVKYGSLTPTFSQMLTYKDILILGVHFINNTEEYHKILVGYIEKWTNDNEKVKEIS